MKKATLFLSLLLISIHSFFAPVISDNDKLASLCKVWGFLKYYHPEVAKGKTDWDMELMNHISPVLQAKSREELSSIYMKWIDGMRDVKERRKPTGRASDSMMNFSTGWMDDKVVFTDTLSSVLHFIERNKHGKRNYYIRREFLFMTSSFRNEEKYEDSMMPSANMRLLALCRYWNIIEYYFPYKYMTGEEWGRVLDDMIPEFIQAKDTIDYAKAIAAVVARTHDSHGYVSVPKSISNTWVSKTPAVKYTIIDGQAIVTALYSDSLAGMDDLRYGDAILKVNGQSVPDIIAQKSKYTSASNEPTMLERMSSRHKIMAGDEDTVRITFERDGIVSDKLVHRYYMSQMPGWKKKEEKAPYKLIDDKLGYVDMGVLTSKHVKETMKQMMQTDALILDLRNYPKGTMYKMAKYLNDKRKPFVHIMMPVWNHPGLFRKVETYKCGKNHGHHYNGQVIVLHNETTQSHAEFTCMALKTAPRVTCLGSQTAGADGDVSKIFFPGGYSTYMTGVGIFYPDGSPTQRIGMVPDIQVTPTKQGIRLKKDEVLDRAIQLAKTGN